MRPSLFAIVAVNSILDCSSIASIPRFEDIVRVIIPEIRGVTAGVSRVVQIAMPETRTGTSNFGGSVLHASSRLTRYCWGWRPSRKSCHLSWSEYPDVKNSLGKSNDKDIIQDVGTVVLCVLILCSGHSHICYGVLEQLG